jgi:hypothetical protein
MSKNFSIQALKMLYSNSNNNIETITNDIEIDFNFCKTYYETTNVELIKKLSINNVKNMNDLNMKIGINFNLSSYSKFFTNIKNEILLKKHYLESLQKKSEHDQILHIILIKNSNFPLESIISDFNNMSIQISLITDTKDDITHYNVTKYICQPENYTEVVNRIIMNNKSNFYTIMHDNYCFEYNFVNRIMKDLFELFNADGLLLIDDKFNNIKTQKTNFFKQEPNTIVKFNNSDNLYICIINNNIKQIFNYSTSDVGILLYYHQVLKNKESFLCTTDYKFKLINNKNINMCKDIMNLVNIYLSNIENTSLIEYDKCNKSNIITENNNNFDDILSLNSITTENTNCINLFNDIFSNTNKNNSKQSSKDTKEMVANVEHLYSSKDDCLLKAPNLQNKFSITEQLILKTITEPLTETTNVNYTLENYSDEKVNIINQLNKQLSKNELIRKESISKINNVLNQPLIEHLKEQVNHKTVQQLKQIVNNKLLDNTDYKFNMNNPEVGAGGLTLKAKLSDVKMNIKKVNNIEIDFLLKEDKDIMNI